MFTLRLNKIRNAAVALALAASISHGAVATVGGNVQVANLLNSNAQLGLDMTSVGTFIEIANFTITQNTTSFDLTLAFANGGRFLRVGGGGTAGERIDMTGLRLNPLNTNTGTGIAVVNPATACPAAVATVTTITTEGLLTGSLTPGTAMSVVWDPANQTTPTVGYIVSLRASWAAGTNVMSGLYTETITATLTATL